MRGPKKERDSDSSLERFTVGGREKARPQNRSEAQKPTERAGAQPSGGRAAGGAEGRQSLGQPRVPHLECARPSWEAG